jgi:hypothetical protein
MTHWMEWKIRWFYNVLGKLSSVFLSYAVLTSILYDKKLRCLGQKYGISTLRGKVVVNALSPCFCVVFFFINIFFFQAFYIRITLLVLKQLAIEINLLNTLKVKTYLLTTIYPGTFMLTFSLLFTNQLFTKPF